MRVGEMTKGGGEEAGQGIRLRGLKAETRIEWCSIRIALMNDLRWGKKI